MLNCDTENIYDSNTLCLQYEHSVYISTLLGGKEAEQFSPQLVAKIREMFVNIQKPWLDTKPPGRSNFINYNHCLYKMMELLGEDEHSKRFKLLKAPKKRYEQDQMWKAICEKMEWEFWPSV